MSILSVYGITNMHGTLTTNNTSTAIKDPEVDLTNSTIGTKWKRSTCEQAEECLKTVIQQYGEYIDARIIDLEEQFDKERIKDLIKEIAPERYNLCQSKSSENIDELSTSDFFDRVLACDLAVTFGDKLVFVDVTDGSSTVIKNKRAKLFDLEPTLKEIGVDQTIVLAIREGFEPDEELALGIAQFVEQETSFVVDIRVDSSTVKLYENKRVKDSFER